MDAELPFRDPERAEPEGPAAGYSPFEGEPSAYAPPEAPVEPPPPPPVFRRPDAISRLLAGLESGILGAALMILWFAVDAILEGQYWWAMLNLWGAGVYHNQVFSLGLGRATVVGAATHFSLHGTGGAIWGLLASRMTGRQLHLVASLGAAWAWYYVLMHGFWPAFAPLVSRLSPSPATLLAYVIFGVTISRSARRARYFMAQSET